MLNALLQAETAREKEELMSKKLCDIEKRYALTFYVLGVQPRLNVLFGMHELVNGNAVSLETNLLPWNETWMTN